MRSSKASKEAKQPDKEAQQEQKLILKDVRDKMFRAAVVPAAYSVEEFLLGMCKFDEIRMKTIKLTEDEVSSRCRYMVTVHLDLALVHHWTNSVQGKAVEKPFWLKTSILKSHAEHKTCCIEFKVQVLLHGC